MYFTFCKDEHLVTFFKSLQSQAFPVTQNECAHVRAKQHPDAHIQHYTTGTAACAQLLNCFFEMTQMLF